MNGYRGDLFAAMGHVDEMMRVLQAVRPKGLEEAIAQINAHTAELAKAFDFADTINRQLEPLREAVLGQHAEIARQLLDTGGAMGTFEALQREYSEAIRGLLDFGGTSKALEALRSHGDAGASMPWTPPGALLAPPDPTAERLNRLEAENERLKRKAAELERQVGFLSEGYAEPPSRN